MAISHEYLGAIEDEPTIPQEPTAAPKGTPTPLPAPKPATDRPTGSGENLDESPSPPSSELEAAYWGYSLTEGDKGGMVLTFDEERYNARYGALAWGRDFDSISRGGNLIMAYGLGHLFDENGPTVPLAELDAAAVAARAERNKTAPDEDPFWVEVAKLVPTRPKTDALVSLYHTIARPIALQVWKEHTGLIETPTPLNGLETPDFLTHEYPRTADIIDGLLPGHGLRATIANSKVGKTMLSMQEAICVGAGIPFLGRETQQGRVLFIEEEGAAFRLQQRAVRMLSALQERHGTLKPEVKWVLRQQTNIATPEGIARLRDLIEDYKPRLVIIGPLSMVGHLTNENDAAEMQRTVRTLLAISSDYDLTIDIAHHRKKLGKDGTPTGVMDWFDTIRGSSALLGGIDIGVGLDRDIEDEYGRMYVISRDGPPMLLGYRFDFTTLLHEPEDTVPSAVEKAPLLEVRDYVRQHGRVLIKDIATAFDVAPATAATRLSQGVAKEQLWETIEGSRKTKVYTPRNWHPATDPTLFEDENTGLPSPTGETE